MEKCLCNIGVIQTPVPKICQKKNVMDLRNENELWGLRLVNSKSHIEAGLGFKSHPKD